MSPAHGVNSQDFTLDLICKHCSKEFTEIDVSTDDYGMIAHVCDACGCESLYEEGSY